MEVEKNRLAFGAVEVLVIGDLKDRESIMNDRIHEGSEGVERVFGWFWRDASSCPVIGDALAVALVRRPGRGLVREELGQ